MHFGFEPGALSDRRRPDHRASNATCRGSRIAASAGRLPRRAYRRRPVLRALSDAQLPERSCDSGWHRAGAGSRSRARSNARAGGGAHCRAPRAKLTERIRTRRAQLAKDSAGRDGDFTATYLSHAIGEAVGKDAIIFNEYPLRPRSLRARKAGHVLRARARRRARLGPWRGARREARGAGELMVATLGDGAYMFANPTVGHWVSAVHKLPILTVVFNNSRYGAVRRATLSMFKDGAAGENDGRTLADLDPSPPFEEMARAQGGMPSAWKNPPSCPRRWRARARLSSTSASRRCSTSLRLIEAIPHKAIEKSRRSSCASTPTRISSRRNISPRSSRAGHADIGKRVREIPCIHDLDVRRKIVDSFPDYAQILSYPMPPLEVMTKGDAKLTEEYTKLINDGFAEICAKVSRPVSRLGGARRADRAGRRRARGRTRDQERRAAACRSTPTSPASRSTIRRSSLSSRR